MLNEIPIPADATRSAYTQYEPLCDTVGCRWHIMRWRGQFPTAEIAVRTWRAKGGWTDGTVFRCPDHAPMFEPVARMG